MYLLRSGIFAKSDAFGFSPLCLEIKTMSAYYFSVRLIICIQDGIPFFGHNPTFCHSVVERFLLKV